MSRSFVSMEVFLQTSRRWIRFAPLNATRRFHTRGHSVILCGLTLKMWIPGPSVHEVQAGCLVQKSQMRYTLLTYQWTVHKNAILYPCNNVMLMCFVSLFTSTTWSSSAVRISWCMKATSLCLTRSWWLCGRHPTTATGVETLHPSWSSRMSTDESPNCFVLFPTLSASYRPGQPPPTFSNNNFLFILWRPNLRNVLFKCKMS